MKKNTKAKGFIAIVSFLVIGVVTLGIAVSISLLGVEEAKSSLTYLKGKKTAKLAEGCSEEALLRLRNNQNYSGGTLNLSEGSCTLNITNNNSNKNVEITAQLNGTPSYVRKLFIEARVSGSNLNIISWQIQ